MFYNAIHNAGLDREEIEYLLANTHFNEEEIKQWFTGFMVIFLVFDFF